MKEHEYKESNEPPINRRKKVDLTSLTEKEILIKIAKSMGLDQDIEPW